ncbi:hypothetical protein ACIFOE_22190 [Paenibacillus sp. NRS-1783]|uniref:hypothetical protein n=1 Tax=Paenibacillus sp. NRS-1783 TaxID=3233907 RepID=UPI003D2A2A7D
MKVDISNLAGRAMAERINRELKKVAENVMDPNTKAEAVRTVTVTIKIKPNIQFRSEVPGHYPCTVTDKSQCCYRVHS